MLKSFKEEIIYCLREDWEARLDSGFIQFQDFLLEQYASLYVKTCALTVAAFLAGIFAAYLVWGTK
ncbi:MAG TPA: hypothetical protein PLX33_09800 [Alphaproteobacteria bacterium]|nr:hypothetical protein [Alphaproteobacteria bacterium]